MGAAACAPCHAEIAESFAATGMGRSFRAIDASRSAAGFDAGQRFEDPAQGLAYAMFRRDGSLWMRQEVLDDDGAVLASIERELLYEVGSGNHARSYLTGQGGLLFQAPVCWYPGKPGWDYCPGYEVSNAFFNRGVEDDCLGCHNARMARDPERPARYAAGLPEGIDCERCHGPGARHAARWSDPEAGGAGEAPDGTIVNPAKLPAARRMDVCAQCHMGGIDSTERIFRRDDGLLGYRPGGPLAAHVQVMGVEHPSAGSFGLSSQVERLMRSRCYTESGGEIGCLSCHNPHVSVYTDDGSAERFRRACLGCHAVDGCALDEPERIEQAGSDDCVSCHMRSAEPADQRFTTFTDHWIRRRLEVKEKARDWEAPRLVALLDDGEAPASDAERLLYEGAALYKMMMREPEIAARVPIALPEAKLEEALEADPSLTAAWSLRGQIALRQGFASRAIGFLREAVARDPADPGAARALGATLIEQGRAREAVEILARAARLEPGDITARVQTGRALVILGEEAEAGRIFDEVLEEHPWDFGALANAGLLAARRGEHGRAEELLRRAGAVDPGEPTVWKALASSLLALDRPGDALGASLRATRLAPESADAYFTLALALEATGRRQGAIAALDRSLKLDPGHAGARGALERLQGQAPASGSRRANSATASSS